MKLRRIASMHSATERASSFIARLKWRDIPQDARDTACRAIADTLGVTVAGAATEGAEIVYRWAAATRGTPAGRILRWGAWSSSLDAALANGTASHALDFDDDDPVLSIGHPSAPVVAALASIVHEVRPTGERLAEAYVAGVEVSMRLGAAMNPDHYDRGWHSTSTLGVLGAAAAVAKMLELEEDEIRCALGIAASSASGVRANFGSMTKPLHVGKAARDGILAAYLARLNFSADLHTFEHPLGFVAASSDSTLQRLDTEIGRLGLEWALVDPGLTVKRYPCCSSTHTAIDGLIELRNSMRFTAQDIRSITCHVGPGTERTLIHRRPTTGLEAKFSMEHCLAVAAVNGDVTVEDFSDSAVGSFRIADLRRRVTMKIDVSMKRGKSGVATGSRLVVELEDGRTFEIAVDVPFGSPRRPLTTDQLSSKFVQCVAGVEPDADKARQLFESLISIAAAEDPARLLDALCWRQDT